MQNRVKIDLKLCPGGAWGVPRGLSGASRGTVRAHFETQLKINESFQGFWEAPGTSREPPGDPKNRPQNVFLLKKGVPNVNFLRFLRAKPLFNLFARFFLFFSRKIDEKSMKKTIHVFTASLVFLNMATLTKHCILRYESYFAIFGVLAFCF